MQLVVQKVQNPTAKVISLPRGTTPAVCPPPRLRMAFVRAAEWDMPIWDIDRLTRGQPLTAIVLWVIFPGLIPILSAVTAFPLHHGLIISSVL